MYNPTTAENKARFVLYDRLEKMRKLKDKKMPHFAGQYGQRSFNDYLDDSERLINGYTLSREAQGKEDWQSNMLDNVARAKMRGIASGVGLKVPEIHCSAVNSEGYRSPIHADFTKGITKQTFLDGNPTLHTFLEVWHLLSHGVVFEYDGYQTGGSKIRRVKSFDSRTGAIEEESVYVEGKGKPVSTLINPQEFFWWDMFVRDIQQQPHLAWVQHYSQTELEREFSKFKNYKEVKDKKRVLSFNELAKTLYFDKWQDRVELENDYEVIRFYSLEDDIYEVWCNGIPLLRAPMLWGHEEKYYPFAKSIAEPFANTNFFVGMSFAGILEAYADTKNTVINTMIDKLYRSMDPSMLIGLANKDLLDVEAQFDGGDGRYYVPNVEQVKPIPIAGINQGELAFLQVIDRGIESLSIDRSQQGLETSGDRTAREAVIADERARELKGMLYLFLEDLWYQKYILRTRTVLTHYLKDKAAQKKKRDNIITIDDYSFGTGERGVLDIHVAKSKDGLMPPQEIEAREQAAEQMGVVYKIISFPISFMDDWHFNYQIIPGSFHNQDRIRQESEFDSEVQWLATFNPQLLVANIDNYTEEKLGFRGKHMDELNPPAPPAPPMMPSQDMAQTQPQTEPSQPTV
jgi:hypothetical protein